MQQTRPRTAHMSNAGQAASSTNDELKLNVSIIVVLIQCYSRSSIPNERQENTAGREVVN